MRDLIFAELEAAAGGFAPNPEGLPVYPVHVTTTGDSGDSGLVRSRHGDGAGVLGGQLFPAAGPSAGDGGSNDPSPDDGVFGLEISALPSDTTFVHVEMAGWCDRDGDGLVDTNETVYRTPGEYLLYNHSGGLAGALEQAERLFDLSTFKPFDSVGPMV